MKRRTVADVMTSKVHSVFDSASFKDIVQIMDDFKITAVPVVDLDGRLVGIVSEADLLLKEEHPVPDGKRIFESKSRRVDRKKAESFLAKDLMTTPVVTTAPDTTLGEAARIMHAKGVKRLPVTDEAGMLVGIVSRGDVLSVYLRSDEEIRDEIVHDVVEHTLWMDPSELRIGVDNGIVSLEGRVETFTLGRMLTEMIHGVEGVVGVESRLSFDLDDRNLKPPPVLPWGVLPKSLRRP